MTRFRSVLLMSVLWASTGCEDGRDQEEIAQYVESLGGKIKRRDGASRDRVMEVDLRNTKVTDPEMKALAKLRKLRTLYLGFTQVSDAGLKDLVNLDKLQVLDLGATQVTDAGLKNLAEFEKLKMLFLGCTKVTDVGLKELAKVDTLQYLDLNNTKTTKAGIAELQKALPKCRINHTAE